jgi:hypothetical protein
MRVSVRDRRCEAGRAVELVVGSRKLAVVVVKHQLIFLLV